jgi:protein-tyrosine-phosphatase
MSERPYNVLFLCTGNSCRSILAEAIMNREGQGRFKAYSAARNPAGAVNPHALALLKKFNYPVSAFRSKPWDEFERGANPDAPELDFVFTVCDDAAGEVCRLAGTADERPLGDARPGARDWQRRRDRLGFRRHLPDAQQPDHDLHEPAAGQAGQALPPDAAGRDRKTQGAAAATAE